MGKFEPFCANFTDIWDQIMGFTFVTVLSGILVKPQSCVLLLIHFHTIYRNIINAWLQQKDNLYLEKVFFTFKRSLVDLDNSLTEKSLLW